MVSSTGVLFAGSVSKKAQRKTIENKECKLIVRKIVIACG